MAYELVILPRAQEDLRDIVEYLARGLGSPQAASNFLDEFDNACEMVCAMPHMYALSRFDKQAELGYRAMPVKRYVALYAVRDGRVVIAHIFHQTQDYARYV